MTAKTKVALVHQGIWDMEKLSMPLALGYLKAVYVDARHPVVGHEQPQRSLGNITVE